MCEGAGQDSNTAPPPHLDNLLALLPTGGGGILGQFSLITRGISTENKLSIHHQAGGKYIAGPGPHPQPYNIIVGLHNIANSLKGQCHEISDHFLTFFLTQLSPLLICWSIFAYTVISILWRHEQQILCKKWDWLFWCSYYHAGNEIDSSAFYPTV